MASKSDESISTGLQQDINKITINHSLCDHCGVCVGVCSGMALVLCGRFLEWQLENCIGCLECVSSCPMGALHEERYTYNDSNQRHFK